MKEASHESLRPVNATWRSFALIPQRLGPARSRRQIGRAPFKLPFFFAAWLLCKKTAR